MIDRRFTRFGREMPETINPYESPPEPSEPAIASDATNHPPELARSARVMAGALTVASIFWWTLVSASAAMLEDEVLLIYLSPGYIATCGLAWRAIGSPSLPWCRAIWGLALVVHTTLLALGVFLWSPVLILGAPIPVFMCVYGLFRDPGEC